MSDSATVAAARPEHNVTGIDYTDRRHFRYSGPLIDLHSHVLLTRPTDPENGPPTGKGPDASIKQAEVMLAIGQEFGIAKTYSMCFPDDIPELRERFGAQIGFNGSITKKREEPDEAAYRLLDRFVELGVEIIKFWSAPRGRERGLLVNAPWRIEAAKRARAAGIRIVMVHVGDPDVWFAKTYADSSKFGTKLDQYQGLEQMLQAFPDMTWIGAHMGGDPEHPDHLEALLERYPHYYLDTSATKWQVREVSPRRDAIRSLVCRYPKRFFFGTDLVTRHQLPAEHYTSRYWSQRTLWESSWEGPSPIADPDFTAAHSPIALATPQLQGLDLPLAVLEQVYFRNARQLLSPGPTGA
jgi:predicted TIM-barrel fold metal-dependent hydrolase